MDTEEILEGLRTKIKGSETKENIEERAEEIRKRLEKEVKKGHYAELKEIGADLKDIAHILAYTENEASFVKKVIEKQSKFKNDPANFGKRLEKTRMKILFLKRSGEYDYYHKLTVEERKKEFKTLRKYPEWYHRPTGDIPRCRDSLIAGTPLSIIVRKIKFWLLKFRCSETIYKTLKNSVI